MVKIYISPYTQNQPVNQTHNTDSRIVMVGTGCRTGASRIEANPSNVKTAKRPSTRTLTTGYTTLRSKERGLGSDEPPWFFRTGRKSKGGKGEEFIHDFMEIALSSSPVLFPLVLVTPASCRTG